MGSNIIELAKLGHERAAELKASCGAVDVQSVAQLMQLIGDLATQLEVQFVRSTNMAVQLANSESKCRELAEFKSRVYAQMGAGCEAPEFAITEGLNNLRRFTDTLHAIEREYFTKDVPDEECEGETSTECPLRWGMTVEQYVSEFGKCLAEVQASARNEGINYAASRLAAAFNHGFVDKPLTEVCDVVRMILDTKEELANSTLPAVDGISGEYAEKFLAEFAAQLRKGAAL
ncbi:eae-like domain protein [Salmonella enterica]|nr:eae-like domain protein [Salmonella enterica]MCQ7735322.1 eae-like domain protein [Salmonella enterica]MCQ7739634.1 eae-like domain protein [Salmonella enterica]MDJ9089324.1 eae-like domain protein [Salmonella enterica]